MTLRDFLPGLKRKSKARLSRGKPEPERSGVHRKDSTVFSDGSRGGVGPTNSHLQLEDSGDVNPCLGESDGMQAL